MSLVALIFGSGANVGKSVATKLKEQGYRVALGSRNAQPEEGFYPIKVDVTNAPSVSQAFAEVDQALGPPNVVIFNASIQIPAPTSGDPLSVSPESFTSGINLLSGVFVAAQEAVKRFKTHSGPKVFITTGNFLPYLPKSLPIVSEYVVLGSQKIVQAYLTELFSNAYANNGIRFHYAHLVGSDGAVPPITDFQKGGPAHAKAYWDLISSPEPKVWDYRFTLNGEKYPDY